MGEGELLSVTIVRFFWVGIYFEVCELVNEAVYAQEVGEPGLRGLVALFEGGTKGLVGDGVGRSFKPGDVWRYCYVDEVLV